MPRTGSRQVSEGNCAEPLEIRTPIWHAKAETARAVRQRIRSVLEWAVAMELRADNPCDRVLPVLGPQSDIVQHRRALIHKDVAGGAGVVVGCAGDQAGVRISGADGGAVRYVEIPAVAHGFRSSFRDWAAEETLAHVVPNEAEAAYARSDLFERRRRLMDDWASAIETR